MTERDVSGAPQSRGTAIRVTPGIALGQFLKFCGACASGGEAKALVESDEVRVNGVLENRRGRKLCEGDEVEALGRRFLVELR